MQLIGMLDSPYVRRVAISLQLLGLPFEHRSISVFRTFEQFKGINPVVKAPTLVCDDGTVLMDSTLMLDYAETLAAARGTGRSLMPGSLAQRQHALRVIGLALAACEKSVQFIYEQTLRPAEKQHQPWLDRVQGQLLAACAALEAEVKRVPPAATSDTIDQAGLTCAVSWQFLQQTRPGLVPVADHPVLQAYSQRVEQLPEFAAAPHGDGTVAARG